MQAKMSAPFSTTVGTTPVRLFAANALRGALRVQNRGEVPIYLGVDDTVTADDGIEIIGSGSLFEPLAVDRNEVWAVTASSTCDVRCQEGDY